jgi:tetratricopeptide (TPR) repeat protein
MLDGDRAVSINVENACPVVCDWDEWPYLLDGADDAYELDDVSEEQVVSELDLAWRKDRSLHLTLIFLDGDAEQETRKESAGFLENLLSDDRIFKYIVNRLHVAPMPATADLRSAVKIARDAHPKVEAILKEISNAQEAIKRSRQAWDLLPADVFGSLQAKESFGFRAVEQGLFTAMSSNSEIDKSGFSLADIEVVKRWRREIKSLKHGHGNGSQIDSDTIAGRKKMFRRPMIAAAVAACIVAAVAAALAVGTRPAEASSAASLGTSAPGFQVVQASLTGLQHELYGHTLIPNALRNQSKRRAEHLFISGQAEASAGRLEHAATAFRDSNASFPTIAAKLNEAVALLNSSELLQTERLLDSALRDADQQGSSKFLKAAILTNLGHIYRTQGRFDDADKSYSSALTIDRDNKYRGGEAADLNNLGLVLCGRGKFVKGLKAFREALTLAEETGIQSVAADSRLNIATTLSSFGRGREAEEDFKSVAAYYERQATPLGQAYYNLVYGQQMFTYVIAASFYGKTAPRETDQALSYYGRARDLYRSVSNKSGEALALLEIGQASRAKGQFHEALEYYTEALRLTEGVGDVPGQMVTFREIGAWYSEQKMFDLAILNNKRSLDIARRIGAYGGQCTALENLMMATAVMGDSDEALQQITEAIDVALISGDAFVQAYAYDDLGFLLYKSFHKNTEAVAALEHAFSLYSEVDSPLRDQTRELIEHIKRSSPPGQAEPRSLQ